MAGTSALIVVDAGYGEGGGALVRTALTMSAMTQQAVRLDNVRGGTRFPGLDVEDLVILGALTQSCRAETVGVEPGSSSFSFLPTQRAKGLTTALEAVRTSTGRGPNALIVLGTLIPVMARSGVFATLTAEGETFGHNSLSYDYFAHVTLEAYRRMGLYCTPDLLRPGFGRESDGEVRIEIEPSVLAGQVWTERGSLRGVHAVVSTSGLPSTVADRAIAHLKNMSNSAGIRVDTEHVDCAGKAPGVHVSAWADYERGLGGGVAMGAKGIKAETLAQNAFSQLTEWMATSATVDEFLADQLLLPLVFAEGDSSFSVPRLTQRLLTAVWVVKQFTPIHITVRGLENGPGTVSIRR